MIIFSAYPCHTKNPNDPSIIGIITDDKISYHRTNGRLSGLCLSNNQIIACQKDGIATINKNLQINKLFSHKLLNQMHGIAATDDHIYVCSTGLDLLLKFDKSGNLLSHWHPDGKTLDDFKLSDYRYQNYHNLGTNKHHLNNVLIYDDNIFICCGKTKTYYQLDNNFNVINKLMLPNDGERHIAHDGVIEGNSLWFTDSSGKLFKWNYKENKVESFKLPWSWVRGLCAFKDDFLVGISSVGKSQPKISIITKYGEEIKSWLINCKLINEPQIYSIVNQ